MCIHQNKKNAKTKKVGLITQALQYALEFVIPIVDLLKIKIRIRLPKCSCTIQNGPMVFFSRKGFNLI